MPLEPFLLWAVFCTLSHTHFGAVPSVQQLKRAHCAHLAAATLLSGLCNQSAYRGKRPVCLGDGCTNIGRPEHEGCACDVHAVRIYWQTPVTVPDARKVPNAIYRQTPKVWAFTDMDIAMPPLILEFGVWVGGLGTEIETETETEMEMEFEFWVVGAGAVCSGRPGLGGPPDRYEARDTDQEETKQWVFIHDTGPAAPTRSYSAKAGRKSGARCTLAVSTRFQCPMLASPVPRRTAQTQNCRIVNATLRPRLLRSTSRVRPSVLRDPKRRQRTSKHAVRASACGLRPVLHGAARPRRAPNSKDE
ncbi:hypothetical protein JB92DRAFT_3232308 [Gautieria morchelliformis]|nr:hypothetical protein JB92DRAFT_3232308 [Gautieria morchelliformis]